MSGHVEGFFEAFVSLTIDSTKGPFAYDGHSIGQFMARLEEALQKVAFEDPVFKGETHAVKDAIVFHVGPTLSSLQYHVWEAAGRKPVGDIKTPPGSTEHVGLLRRWISGGR